MKFICITFNISSSVGCLRVPRISRQGYVSPLSANYAHFNVWTHDQNYSFQGQFENTRTKLTIWTNVPFCPYCRILVAHPGFQIGGANSKDGRGKKPIIWTIVSLKLHGNGPSSGVGSPATCTLECELYIHQHLLNHS